MHIPKTIMISAALIAAVVTIAAGYMILRPPVALLSDAAFDKTRISPNADGVDDVTTIRYSLARSALVSIYLDGQAGQRFYFRQNERRSPGDYIVEFSGVVDGYTLDGENIPGEIERRLIPNDRYTWAIEAVNDDENKRSSGTLEIAEANSALPVISFFEISPTVFTPNQDGIRDRTNINLYLEKPAALSVYLVDVEGLRYYLGEREKGREPGDMGSHEFDYDGGVDQGLEPPADGTYTLYASAQDAEGQRIVRQAELTLQDGGLPQVEISSQTSGATVWFGDMPYDDTYFTDDGLTGKKVEYPAGVTSDLTTLTMLQGDLLVFRLTINNYGSTPIRTAGPFPGAVYQFDQTAASLGAFEQAGAWRVGINCQTAYSDFPWRWAMGPLDELHTVVDEETSETYYYLMPGQRAEVWGAVRMTRIFNARNPQECWAGLIHEEVDVPTSQSRVGAREIKLDPIEKVP
ncbi:MAG: hypothetical protein HY866_19800 [Chloroflexi bacterium]|nr:hypothetical protein [Chloroflexota bacterium]